jgi:hypothetical protein
MSSVVYTHKQHVILDDKQRSIKLPSVENKIKYQPNLGMNLQKISDGTVLMHGQKRLVANVSETI